MLVCLTGLLAAHVAFVLRRVSGTVALLQAVLHTHRLRADLERSGRPSGRGWTDETEEKKRCTKAKIKDEQKQVEKKSLLVSNDPNVKYVLFCFLLSQ